MIQSSSEQDEHSLKQLNAQFIKNFITQNVEAHDKILHKDFVCIENSGHIVNRDEYLRAWAHAYENSGCISFDYGDEVIKIFGNVALVRSKTIYTKRKDGTTINGSTVYTDTYLKENGEWKCVQAQITPVQ